MIMTIPEVRDIVTELVGTVARFRELPHHNDGTIVYVLSEPLLRKDPAAVAQLAAVAIMMFSDFQQDEDALAWDQEDY